MVPLPDRLKHAVIPYRIDMRYTDHDTRMLLSGSAIYKSKTSSIQGILAERFSFRGVFAHDLSSLALNVDLRYHPSLHYPHMIRIAPGTYHATATHGSIEFLLSREDLN